MVNIEDLKGKFKNGMIPDENDYGELIDSSAKEIEDAKESYATLREKLNSFDEAKETVNTLFNSGNVSRVFSENQYVTRAYWSDIDGKAGFDTRFSYYYSLPELIAVKSGDKLTLKNWNVDSTESSSLAYAGYKSDNTPYNGVSSRINFSTGVWSDKDNSFTFVIPEGVEKIGISIRVLLEDGDLNNILNNAVFYIGSGNVTFSEYMKELVVQNTSHEIEKTDFFKKGYSNKETNKKVGLIVAGQSNTDGRVPKAQLPNYIIDPLPNVNYSSNYIQGHQNGNFQNPFSVPARYAYDTIVYHHLTQDAQKEVYVMKWSQGATSIDPTGATENHWTAEYEELPSLDNSLIRKFESLIRACLEAKGSEFNVRAMLWHQGEGDYAKQYPTASKNYYRNLKNVVAYCRGIVGNVTLPFICGTIPHKSAQYDPVIEDAYRRLEKEDPYFFLVDMNDATLLDAYHFDDVSTEYFGKAMYDLLIDSGAIEAEKLNPTPPWNIE